MGIIALIIGCIVGYFVTEKVTAKNWGLKLCYALGAPIALITVLAIVLTIITGSSYLAGTYSTSFIIACIPYIIWVLVKMKTGNKSVECKEREPDKTNCQEKV